MNTQNSKSQKTITPNDPLRSQKSRSRLQGLEKTPSAVIYNPYVEQLDDRSTSKKRRDPSTPFVPPILVDQNKHLIAENRQLTVLIHEKSATIQAMQGQLNMKAEAEIAIFREVQSQKKRLIQEILQHKQATDQQLSALANEVSVLQQEKATLQRQYQMEMKKQELSVQQDRQKEVGEVRLQHQQAVTLLKAEIAKLKDDLQHRSKQAQIQQLESRQRVIQATSRCDSLGEELKHLQQVRRLQQADLKTQYQSRIQKLHLENRREKELFLIEHDSQVRRLQEECKRLRKMVEELESTKQDLREAAEMEKGQREDYQERVHYEAETSIDHIRRVSISQREKLQTLLKNELSLLESSNQQEVLRLQGENQRSCQLVALKQREIERLLQEIDEMREGKLLQLEQNEKLVRELESKLLASLLDGETENQALKTKLARLREADITGLRNYYHNQIQLLSRGQQEKEAALASAREKHHQQLRRKIEMRKNFDLEVLKYKSRIIELQSHLDSQKAKNKQLEEQVRQQTEAVAQEVQRQTGGRSRVEQFRNEECRHLQAIITAKDAEIEELTQRLELLKEHHGLERAGWHSELQAEQQLHEITKSERVRAAETFEGQLSKAREVSKREKEELQRDLKMLKEEQRADFDEVALQLATVRQEAEDEKQRLLVQLKRKELEIQKLGKALASREKDIEELLKTTQQEKIQDNSRERQQLEQFYGDKLRIKEELVLDLEQRIEELTSDLRDARENYNDLEKRMEQLIESQAQLREVERRVIQMGKENNLTKNLQEILK